jgi:protein-S-isoprenylcysteine O-methyltransferase Ste14
MLPEILTATFLGICLGIFYLVNLINLLGNRIRRKAKATREEPQQKTPEPPRTLTLGLAAFGTIVFWLISIFYVLLIFTGVLPHFDWFLLPLRFPQDSCVQILGIILAALGYFLFTWSVIARGRFATAWEMPENHKLVTWGPYKYVRHPSYLAYFIMFPSLFFIWLTWISLIPILAIPSYLQIVGEEEKYLIQRFGDEYITYQKNVGQFFPKWKTTESKG